jgi:acetyl-CoA synthetase
MARTLTVADNPAHPRFWGKGVAGKRNIEPCRMKTWRKNKLALIWESEDGKFERTFSYYALNREVSRMANIIKAMGVKKGDRVTIYMGRIPEIVFAMLACAKIGARTGQMQSTSGTDAYPEPRKSKCSGRGR